MSQNIHLVGFGSQAAAWAQCLKRAGWPVHVYLGHAASPSFERAKALGFAPMLTQDLRAALMRDTAETALVAMLTPDHLIAPIYGDFIAQAARPTTLILAHGYAVYASELTQLSKGHELALLAPKAIGPKLQAAHEKAFPEPHTLVAAFHSSATRVVQLRAVAAGLGFSATRLVSATFEQEAIGDLISEQALLCGGVFSLLEWTMKAMKTAGIPDRLIHEECITELELIANLIKERGPSATFAAISQAAQCGTISMSEELVKAGVPALIEKQAEAVVSRKFVEYMRTSDWREKARDLKARFELLEKK